MQQYHVISRFNIEVVQPTEGCTQESEWAIVNLVKVEVVVVMTGGGGIYSMPWYLMGYKVQYMNPPIHFPFSFVNNYQ